MKESELMEAIKRYLEDPTDDYAIMITGAWGCGKTHFVENRLKTEIGADGWRVVRISMFGVQSEEVFLRQAAYRYILFSWQRHRGWNGETWQGAQSGSAISFVE